MQPASATRRKQTVRVAGRLRVKADRVGAGLGEIRDLPVGVFDHQVAVEDAAGVVDLVGDRGDDQRPDRDRRDERAVHHVDVDDPRACRHHVGDLGAEPGEVGREDRRGDADALQRLGVHSRDSRSRLAAEAGDEEAVGPVAGGIGLVVGAFAVVTGDRVDGQAQVWRVRDHLFVLGS